MQRPDDANFAFGATRQRDSNDNVVGGTLISESLLMGSILSDPHDMNLKGLWIALQRNLAMAEPRGSRTALARLIRASQSINELLIFDPTNETWTRLRDAIDQDLEQFSPVERTGS